MAKKQKEVVLPPIKYRESPNKSSRRGQQVTLFVVHSTEGGYEGSISWLCNPRAQASSHLVLKEDGSECTQLVPYNEKAWTQAAFNGVAESLELAGRKSQYDQEFEKLRHKKIKPLKKQLKVGARIAAFRLHKRGLPPRWAKNGQGKGICRHADLGLAGGGHTDPFSTFGWLLFMARVKYEYRRGHFRNSWGREN